MIESGMSSQKRILIVDDQKNAAETFKSNLELLNKNLHISILPSTEETLLELKQNTFDLVISDILLPGKSGFELLEYIKKTSPQTKVFIVSGVGDRDIKKKIAKAGADAFFYKPVDIAEFLDAVERILGFIGTLLKPELQLEIVETEEIKPTGLSTKLSTLKQDLDAQAVFLIGNAGQILMSEGELPGSEFENTFIPRLSQLIKIRESIPEELNSVAPQNLHSFRIMDYDILSIQLISSYILLIAFPKDQFANFSSIYQSTTAIYQNLQNLGVTTVLDASILDGLSLNEDNKKEDGADDALLSKALETDVNPEDADSFWEEDGSINSSAPEPGTASLSFDEAKDLGLEFSQD